MTQPEGLPMTRVVDWQPRLTGLGPCVAALGVFDGVHKGHAALIGLTVRRAREMDLPAAVVTFDPDPAAVVGHAPGTRLLDPAEKAELIAALGVDLILVVPFDEGLASWEPERFVTEVLVETMQPKLVLVGPEFRFGAGAAGDAQTLDDACSLFDCKVEVVKPLSHDGARISSTRVRELLANGDVRRAAILLGRPHRLVGPVHRGRGEGRAKLGMATANIRLDEHAALPEAGVYAGVATTEDGRNWPAAISVGRPPMFPDSSDVLEAHLIGFDGDIYGQQLIVEFIERLRDHQVFATPEALGAVMQADAGRASGVISALM